MNLSPVQSFVLLLLIGLALAGWLYGIYWKRVASGASFTKEEKVMIQLQDQINALHEKNSRLSEEIALLKNPDGFAEEPPEAKPTPIDPGVTAPFEKIELPKKGF
ncbi:MAG: hypothetical protein AAF491_06390 [Verrucomicrobiota bacterium]